MIVQANNSKSMRVSSSLLEKGTNLFGTCALLLFAFAAFLVQLLPGILLSIIRSLCHSLSLPEDKEAVISEVLAMRDVKLPEPRTYGTDM